VSERPWWRRHIRALATAGLALLTALVLGALASWHFASFVLVPDHSPWSERVEIEAVFPRRIELHRSDATERPGIYGLVWQAGHAIVGPVISESKETITRRLSDVRGYLEPGTEAGFDSSVYSGNPAQALGLPYRSVAVPSELGPMPAWEIPAAHPIAKGAHSDRPPTHKWVILVHGINDDREVGLRVAPTLHRAGFNSLLISYRDDLGAPESPDGLHHQGQTEWRDLEAAVKYAVRHGTQEIVLDGYSMGGALITQFMERSPLADRIDGLILDAPALNWKAILELNAEEMGLPGFAALPVEWAIQARIDVDWNSLDALRHTDDFHLPILLFHGDDDEVVPIETSEDFAEELPRWVTYYVAPKAGHTQSWNVDPALYNRRLRRFLLQISTETDRARPRGSGSTR
jgi:alpha-beta hydrolase superfamily lysophospholipase